MASLFEIGKSGVQAYRQALSVTGQNIANVNTEGYNKRSADLEEVPSVQGGVTNIPDQSGLGVRVNQIRRSFDESAMYLFIVLVIISSPPFQQKIFRDHFILPHQTRLGFLNQWLIMIDND